MLENAEARIVKKFWNDCFQLLIKYFNKNIEKGSACLIFQ